jgi:hypothetical protein
MSIGEVLDAALEAGVGGGTQIPAGASA